MAHLLRPLPSENIFEPDIRVDTKFCMFSFMKNEYNNMSSKNSSDSSEKSPNIDPVGEEVSIKII